MKKSNVIKLTEGDLVKIVQRVINEQAPKQKTEAQNRQTLEERMLKRLRK